MIVVHNHNKWVILKWRVSFHMEDVNCLIHIHFRSVTPPSLSFHEGIYSSHQREESVVQHVPFAFDLLRLLPKCQQVELLFSTLIQGQCKVMLAKSCCKVSVRSCCKVSVRSCCKVSVRSCCKVSVRSCCKVMLQGQCKVMLQG